MTLNELFSASSYSEGHPPVGTVWTHKARGGRYEVLAIATLQMDNEHDLTPMVVYREIGPKQTQWVRSLAEFMDGRFILTDHSRELTQGAGR